MNTSMNVERSFNPRFVMLALQSGFTSRNNRIVNLLLSHSATIICLQEFWIDNKKAGTTWWIWWMFTCMMKIKMAHNQDEDLKNGDIRSFQSKVEDGDYWKSSSKIYIPSIQGFRIEIVWHWSIFFFIVMIFALFNPKIFASILRKIQRLVISRVRSNKNNLLSFAFWYFFLFPTLNPSLNR